MSNTGGYGLIVILGPLLLAAAIAWAIIRNKQRTPRQERRTEEATRRLYDEGTTENEQESR